MSEDSILFLVGRNVYRIRTSAGLSQQELASASGLNQRYVSLLENGKQNATLVKLTVIACALGVDISELVAPE